MKKKIDSTFNFNFHILEIELKGNDNFEKEKQLYEELLLDDGQIIYINKYLPKSISFFEDISKIVAKRKHSGQSINPYIDNETLKAWKNWYILNRKKIKWCEKENKPYF